MGGVSLEPLMLALVALHSAFVVRDVFKCYQGDITKAALSDKVHKYLLITVVPVISYKALGCAAGLIIGAPLGLSLVTGAGIATIIARMSKAMFSTEKSPHKLAYELFGCGTGDTIEVIRDRANKLLDATVTEVRRAMIIAAFHSICNRRSIMAEGLHHVIYRAPVQSEYPTFNNAWFQTIFDASNINRSPGGILARVDQPGQPNITYTGLIVQSVTRSTNPLPTLGTDVSGFCADFLGPVLEDSRLMFGNHLLLFRGGPEQFQKKAAIHDGSFYVSNTPGALGRGIYLTDNFHKASNYCNTDDHRAETVDNHGFWLRQLCRSSNHRSICDNGTSLQHNNPLLAWMLSSRLVRVLSQSRITITTNFV